MTFLVVVMIVVSFCLLIISTYRLVSNDISLLNYILIMLFAGATFVFGLTQVLVIDKNADMTVGVLVGIEREPLGRTYVYIKTEDSERKHYCIEDEELIQFAKEHTGEVVRVGWGDRVGFYPLNKCRQAPIIHIERWEE
jgi:hypothetical protein